METPSALPPAAMAAGRPQVPQMTADAAAGGGAAGARKAAEEFESVFLSRMLQGMFKGLNTEPPFGGGHSEKVYRSMLVDEYAKGIAAKGGLGLADHVYREILSVQENAGK